MGFSRGLRKRCFLFLMNLPAILSVFGTRKFLPWIHHLYFFEDGEIRIRGHTRFQGYVHGDRLKEPFDENG